MNGRVHQISVSKGGAPKTGVAGAAVTRLGLAGDAHKYPRHGGPDRAVCLFNLETIEQLRDEGHPIQPGWVGENVTVSGVGWPSVVPGTRLRFEGGVELEVTEFTTPCSRIRDAFLGLGFNRIKQELHPGCSRVYARVLREGSLRTGEAVRMA